VRVEPLAEANAAAWSELFVRAHSSCFCRFWHFEGTKNDWLARCALDPDANRVEARGAMARADDNALGLVALEGALAVGWMKLAPRVTLPKLRRLPVYRGLDLGADEGVWSIACFLIDPVLRAKGVARLLLDAAPAFVTDRGGRVLEAYPRHPNVSEGPRLYDEEAMMGPESLFVSRGFERVEGLGETAMYPVYRLRIA
jgi:GNAT superfamily N-acetyltransferase